MNRRDFVAAVARGLARRPDVQFDRLTRRARTVDGVAVAMPPVYTLFVTVRLRRLPRRPVVFRDVIVGYGLPYFDRLPRLVRARCRACVPIRRLALEEAVAGPTDPAGRDDRATTTCCSIAAQRLGARIESPCCARCVLPGLMRVTSRRLMFQQMGLPRKVAERTGCRSPARSTRARRCGWGSPTSRWARAGRRPR